MGKGWGLRLLGIGTGGDSAMEDSVIWEAESGGRLRGGIVDRGLGAETLSIHECAREPGGCSLGSVCLSVVHPIPVREGVDASQGGGISGFNAGGGSGREA